MQYPLTLKFKFFALAPQIFVTDQTGNLIFYVKQKLFKLREQITVCADEAQTQQIYSISADRIIDFSARYHFRDRTGRELGSVKRKGMKSIWKAHYDIASGQSEAPILSIHEENPWIKIIDALFAEIPILGLFTGYFFNPTYLISRPDGSVVMHFSKVPAFWSRIFTLKPVDRMSEDEQQLAVLSLLMMILLERNRG
ncbi:MAG: hypothetical protein HC851_15490 [Acaryochloris sp. RU_4_1]|nr:hypothetical protein [Acaryochloris sp. SU_5_25]NJM66965.1 hypothetical protein [Acaryochloris sp. RU_4_1]NJR55813.1 hypothetical protein [Acaryochloris sp. CRU_2_0]